MSKVVDRAGNQHARAGRSGPGPWIVGVAVLLVVGLLIAEDKGWLSRPEGPRLDLTGARRAELLTRDAYEQFLLGLRAHHYRTVPRSQATYRDVFFDTDADDLLRAGYSFRFRTRMEGPGGPTYGLHVERESRFVSADTPRLEVTSDLPDSVGEAIAAGDWRRALTTQPAPAACARLFGVLAELGLDRTRLKPRWSGELRRERLDVKDKGRTWFQLDHERWVFRAWDDSRSGRAAHVEDVALDVRLSARDPELVRRVRTLDGYLRMLPGVRPVRQAPHERAIATLSGS